MSLHAADVAHVLVALTLLVLVAHVFGHIFAVLRQPPVIGEILGGLLLGPTVLGALAPDVKESLLPETGPTASALGAMYQLGLVFMMFLAGSELRPGGTASERRTIVSVSLFGLALPFGVGLLVTRMVDPSAFSGPKGSPLAFALVFGIAIAVTSIPVISRIMLDLGILGTPFARMVLSVAVLEDIALYVALAVVLGLVQAESSEGFGLWSLTGITSVPLSAAYYVLVSLVFLAVFLLWGHRIFRRLARHRLNALERRSPTAFRVVLMLSVVLLAIVLGINSVFGALVAGVSAARAGDTDGPGPWDGIKQFSLALFVPVYFALVGVQLDLLHNLPVVFFVWFLLLACGVKLAAVWLGARVAGEGNTLAVNLAVALNARGGPGIVLATVTFTAGIINAEFFTVLVLLSILTSQAAGIWLDRVFRGHGGRDRGEEGDEAQVDKPDVVRGL